MVDILCLCFFFLLFFCVPYLSQRMQPLVRWLTGALALMTLLTTLHYHHCHRYPQVVVITETAGRAGPGEKYGIVTQVKAREEGVVIQSTAEWSLLRTDTVQSWVIQTALQPKGDLMVNAP